MSPLENVLSALASTDVEIRRRTVMDLSSLDDLEVIIAIAPVILGDADYRVRKEAVALVSSLGSSVGRKPDPELVEALTDGLLSTLCGSAEHVALRNAALEALGGLGSAEPIEQLLRASLELPGSTQRPKDVLDADGRKIAIEALAAVRAIGSTAVLEQALDDIDPNVRASAAEALGAVGGARAELLLRRCLAQQDQRPGHRFFRLVVLHALTQLGARIGSAELLPLLSDRVLRPAVIAALAQSGEPQALRAIAPFVVDRARLVTEAALATIATLGLSAEGWDILRDIVWPEGVADRISPFLKQEQLSPQPIVSRSRGLGDSLTPPIMLPGHGALLVLSVVAETGLGQDRDRAIELFANTFATETFEPTITLSAQRLGPKAFSLLMAAASKCAVEVRCDLARRAGERAPHNSLLPLIRHAMTDPHPDVVAAAFGSLARISHRGLSEGVLLPDLPSTQDLERLVAAAGSRDPRLCSAALGALRFLAPHAPDAALELLKQKTASSPEAAALCLLLGLARSTHPSDSMQQPTIGTLFVALCLEASEVRVRLAALEALRLRRDTPESALPAILNAASDPENEIRRAAGEVLDTLPPVLANKAYEHFARQAEQEGTDTSQRRHVISALAMLHVEEVNGLLERLVNEPDQFGGAGAAHALEMLSRRAPEQARGRARLCLTVDDELVVAAALDVLDMPTDDDERIAVRALLAHESPMIRTRAVECLGRDPITSSIQALNVRIEHETHPAVRLSIARVLAAQEAGNPYPSVPSVPNEPRTTLGPESERP